MTTEQFWPTASVFLGHCAYRQRGGEDIAFATEMAVLRAYGCRVTSYTRNNTEIQDKGLVSGLRLLADTIWARDSYREINQLIHAESFAVAHFHNTFPLLSPAVYFACRRAGVPVVQTLHNYRLVCLNGCLARGGRPCELCVGRAIPWPGIVFRCYRRSWRASLAVAAMLVSHRWGSTWKNKVDVYVALSEFSRNVLIRGGLPPDKIEVLPNAVMPDPGPGEGNGGYALFVGRLTLEKGIGVLLDAWQRNQKLPALHILGDGPMAERVAEATRLDPRITSSGAVAHRQVVQELKGSAVLIAPSLCYENCPLSVVEAMAVGVPIVASDLGAVGQLVANSSAGVLFPPGDPYGLANTVMALLSDSHRHIALGRSARRVYLATHSPDAFLSGLLRIFDKARSRTPGNDTP